MNLVAIESARITWLFPVEEFLPLGGADGLSIIQAISERYNFRHPPANPVKEDIEKNGLKFAGGRFHFGITTENIVELILYNDGVVASANSTEGAESFLNDIYYFLTTNFGFRPVTSQIKKVAFCSVVVDFIKPLKDLVSVNSKIAKTVGAYLNEPENTRYPIEVMRMDFALNKDPEFRPPTIPRLTIETRAHTAFSQHRYFATAPISTTSLLRVLKQIEGSLTN